MSRSSWPSAVSQSRTRVFGARCSPSVVRRQMI
jgi:hypothetical protein